ncbi:probable RNA polymerase II nuclear localization protein SLC7A6OS [Anoplophora glabripennis]|uniref:probable RNA polymerase II nuclear localization protein SLC7A6OS n=1 Tax=Anoplophora glabripennis TaxID=217634 RepID=UPI00087581C5|nr:probable RNA polymerase II nuclear localization protein SLC7A6OS [Anoplophora glabripennis]
MAAVVRVKRRLDEEPLEAVILSCKRRKLNNDVVKDAEDTELSATLLKFAGTIKEDENVVAHLKKERIPEITELREHFKKHAVNINEKLREQMKETSKNNRFKVVNCFRSENAEDSLTAENSTSSSTKKELTIFDIETDLNDNDVKTENQNGESSEPKFVYDLYYTNSDDLGDADIDDYISVYPLSDPLMLGSTRDNGLNDADSDDGSEDSNAENNWRNDYPDESDLESINEDDMVEAMQNVAIDEDLLSSDEGEEGFVYSIDSEAAGFEEDVDESDVFRYGERYAKFKAKHKNYIESSGVENDLYYGDIDENEYYY